MTKRIKLLFTLALLGSSLIGCKHFASINKEAIATYSKILTERTLKNLFGEENIDFEKKYFNISITSSKEKIKKVIGKKISVFLTRKGNIEFTTQKFSIKLNWIPTPSDTTKRDINLIFNKNGS